jgi:transaldolase/glucose-6-phosphate isomerase
VAQNPLKELNRLGQSVWFDYIRRWEMVSGHLQQMIDDDGLSGVTSNPSIFEKAIAGSKDYDEVVQKLAGEGKNAKQIFETLAVEDIQMAADLFLPTYQATQGRDGFVSLEVSPTLAHDTAGTIAEARRLFGEVNRPNVLMKVPGTAEGLPAIEQLLGEGININITLLFAIERYEQVAKAYLAALEKLARQGKPLDRVASVASFFVSRIDTLADQQLEAKLRDAQTPEAQTRISELLGKVAVANAKLAYRQFREIFSTPRFEALAKKGARVQRMLWASTSTKNPKYSDILYVQDLIGPDTVNTMPLATMTAYRDHGKPRATVEEDLEGARSVMTQLKECGIDLRAITQKLEDQGVELFARDFEKLLGVIEEKRKSVLATRPAEQDLQAGADLRKTLEDTLDRLGKEDFPRRLWDRDPSLWKQEAAAQKIIRNALGWLTVSRSMLEHVEAITGFVQEVKRAGLTHAALLGMGGSSLCPDVCRATFGKAPGFLELAVLDSTVPASVAHLEKSLDLPHTLFLVSSKSGGTTETLSFYKYFYERVRGVKGDKAGENFVAITDPGSSLEKLAREKNFRRIFAGHVDIGGRYSALSNFGMVPAALAGVDVRALLERAERMAQACGACVPPRENPGLRLGVTLAEAARLGRNKVTFVISPGIATFADWVEQLLAESTGKEGKGLLPVAGEALGPPDVYGGGRLFIYIKLEAETDPDVEGKLEALAAAGRPVARITLRDKLDLGQEFFRWEIATATAGALLGINAFDQPNVQESKDNTKTLLEQFRVQGKLAEGASLLEEEGLRIYGGPAQARAKSLEDCLAGFLGEARPGNYVALMAYLEPTSEHTATLQSLRTRLRDATGLATTLGYGPRFLHSTGQLHKGGPNTGLFLQFTADDVQDLPIPGEAYSFSVLKQAQALGDWHALESKQRRVLRIHLGKDVAAGLNKVESAVEGALRPRTQAEGR